LRQFVTSRKVAGSILDGVFGILVLVLAYMKFNGLIKRMNHDLVLIIVSLSKNCVELHFIKMEHHGILRFLFVCGLKKIFLVGGLGVEDQQNGLSEVAVSLHVIFFACLD